MSALASISEQASDLSNPLPSPFEPALTHPRMHNHHVATLQLRANGPGESLENLRLFCDFALRAGYALNIPLSKPASLPTRTSLWTVLKGPFVHKKSQENFERRIHKRVIKVWDADVAVVERWLHFLRVHCMNGVMMRAEIYRHFPLSIGSTLLAASTSQLRQVPEGSQELDDSTVRASDQGSDQVVKLAKAIIEEEIAKQDAEDGLRVQQIQSASESDADVPGQKEQQEQAKEVANIEETTGQPTAPTEEPGKSS
jgi:small subunit ribosomal protein S10